MDLNQFFSSLQSSLDSSTLDADYALQCDTLDVQPLPQPSCSNQSLDLLKAFCSDEDTVKSYLLDGDEFNNQLNAQFDSSIENWSNSNDWTSSTESSWVNVNETTTPMPCISTDPLSIESHCQTSFRDSYDALKSNFILLAERGYKLTLSLLTDNSEVDEPWNPDVSQRILSVSFSSLSLRSEYLSTDVKLDGFESLLMDEALAAFKGQKYLNLFENLHDKRRARASPGWLISICNGIKGYRKIENGDKTTLLSCSYYDLNMMEVIFNYDAAIDGWSFPEYKYDRRDAFIFNQSVHDGIVHIIETFPDRLRNDINAIVLMYLIIVFNPDSSELKYSQIIRYEQFSYIYLLRRYLRTICESDCEASDNHYRLMAKIEQIKFLSEHSKKGFDALLNEPLMETIKRSGTGFYHF